MSKVDGAERMGGKKEAPRPTACVAVSIGPRVCAQGHFGPTSVEREKLI